MSEYDGTRKDLIKELAVRVRNCTECNMTGLVLNDNRQMCPTCGGHGQTCDMSEFMNEILHVHNTLDLAPNANVETETEEPYDCCDAPDCPAKSFDNGGAICKGCKHNQKKAADEIDPRLAALADFVAAVETHLQDFGNVDFTAADNMLTQAQYLLGTHGFNTRPTKPYFCPGCGVEKDEHSRFADCLSTDCPNNGDRK